MEKDGLTISSTVSSENEFVIMLGGELTTVTSQALDVYLTTALDDFQRAGLVFDLFDLTYISAQGLRAIYSAYRKLSKLHKPVKIINVKDNIHMTFDVSGFADVMQVSGV